MNEEPNYNQGAFDGELTAAQKSAIALNPDLDIAERGRIGLLTGHYEAPEELRAIAGDLSLEITEYGRADLLKRANLIADETALARRQLVEAGIVGADGGLSEK